VEISQEKIQTLADFWPLVGFLFDGPVDDPAAFKKVIDSDGGVESLQAARDALATAEPFTVENIEAALREVVEIQGAKPAKVFQPVRVAIAGTTVSPGIFESVALLGRDETLARIDRALEHAD
jgi:glutamyl/glutaminyl-tRNA synthetase